MHINDFISGKATQRFEYKSFEPNLVDQEWTIDDPALLFLLNEATHKLGELNAFSQLIPDVDFFIRMHVAKEGTQSSRIEGTQTTFEEAIQEEQFIEFDRQNDWQEVQNYILAMNAAIQDLQELPLSSRLIKKAHKQLLAGVRGKHKMPGEFRKSQNWIGGHDLASASFIPPHPDGLSDLLADFEQFLNNERQPLPPLIKAAIAHYQFETIHPFLDGNGRMGRLLITLFLVNSGQLSLPTLYLSDYLERNRMEYFERLMRSRTHNELKNWIKFFLTGVKETATNATYTFREIIKLRALSEEKIATLGRKAPLGTSFLKYLFRQPITDAASAAKALNINISTMFRLMEDFIQLGILHERTGYKRNRSFEFREYVGLFR